MGRNYLNATGWILPLLMILQFFFLIGPSLVLATLNVFFRDTLQLLNSFLLIGFWITPIIYDLDQEGLRENIPPGLLTTLDLWTMINPFAHLVGLYQDIFFKSRLPSANSILYLILLAALTYIVGKYLFTRSQIHFVDDI